MIAQDIKKLYDIKADIKSALKYIGNNVGDVFSTYPSLIKKPRESFFAKYFEPGPETEHDGWVWSTEKCIFDADNEHLILKERLHEIEEELEGDDRYFYMKDATEDNSEIHLTEEETAYFMEHNYLILFLTSKGYDVYLHGSEEPDFKKYEPMFSIHQPGQVALYAQASTGSGGYRLGYTDTTYGIFDKTAESKANDRLYFNESLTASKYSDFAFELSDTQYTYFYTGTSRIVNLYLVKGNFTKVYANSNTVSIWFPNDLTNISEISSSSGNLSKLSTFLNLKGKTKFPPQDFNFRYCPLTHESMSGFIKSISQSETNHTLSLKATVYAELSEEEVATITGLGYTITTY